MKKHYLSNDWQLRLIDSHDLDVDVDKDRIIPAMIPGTVHTDLLNEGIISDPHYGDNELRLKWIDLCDWSYSTQFNVPPEIQLDKPVNLILKGVDTVADIILNGRIVASVKNMFLEYVYEVSSLLNREKNTLELKFYSAKRHSLAEERKYGKIPVPDSTESDRVYLRKAQYSYGWDWGPAFTTMGIWRDVFLQQKNVAEIRNVKLDTVKLIDKKAECDLSFSVNADDQKNLDAKIEISDYKDNRVFADSIPCDASNRINVSLNNIEPWWPNGMGDPNLYTLKIILTDDYGIIVDEYENKIGVRTIELCLEENESPTFKFIVNGKAVYVKGVNWIPGDSFLPRVTPGKYRNLLQLVKDASMNMVRVWGGGIYENDEFYQICDELGLLVWQDCMFACGSYPEHEEFLESVKDEVEYNLSRIRNHASLALLCGNNENEWIWTMDHDSHYSNMPGHKIYHELVPEISNRICPGLSYWPSSPFGFDKDPNSQTSGNRHQWYIWSGWKDYSEVINDNSLFVTEFGFQGPANIDCFERHLPEENLRIHDKVFEFHNKQVEGPERVIKFLSAHLPLPKTWTEYIYLAQLNQGFALKTCLEHWRCNQPINNGSIIWQINDTWPVTSWSLVDSDEQPKLSYYFVKNSFNLILLTIEDLGESLKISVNNETNEFEGKSVIKLFEAATGEVFEEFTYDVNIGASLNSEIALLDTPSISNNSNWFAVATLYDKDDKIVSRNYFVNQRWKHLQLPEVTFDVIKETDSIKLSVDNPALFVDLYHPGVVFENRGMIILPGDDVKVEYGKLAAHELDTSKLVISTLNNFLSVREKSE